MRTPSAKEAKYGFGRLIDLAHTAPLTVAKYGRSVVVVVSVGEYGRLTSLDRSGTFDAREHRKRGSGHQGA